MTENHSHTHGRMCPTLFKSTSLAKAISRWYTTTTSCFFVTFIGVDYRTCHTICCSSWRWWLILHKVKEPRIMCNPSWVDQTLGFLSSTVVGKNMVGVCHSRCNWKHHKSSRIKRWRSCIWGGNRDDLKSERGAFDIEIDQESPSKEEGEKEELSATIVKLLDHTTRDSTGGDGEKDSSSPSSGDTKIEQEDASDEVEEE